MKKVLVTGGYGFIGSHLVETLIGEGYEVTVIDNLSTGKKENLTSVEGKFKLIEDDLSDLENIQDIVEQLGDQDYVYHLAALARVGRSVENPVETHLVNVNGTLKALEIARKVKAKRFLFASSSSVYGDQDTLPLTEDMVPNPQNPYATQKQIGEEYCRIYSKTFSVPTTAFRFFNVYGPRMATEGAHRLVFAIWIDQIKASKPLTINGTGEQTRDFTHVSDIAAGLLAGVSPKTEELPFEIYNLGSGSQTSLKELAGFFNHSIEYIDPRPFEEMFKEADIEKAKTQLGWQPQTSIQDGVNEMIEYYKLKSP